MRLIDADDLIKELKQIVNTEKIFKSFTTWGNAYEDCMTMLDEAPTIDAVEVVRCKDCIYYGDHGDEEMACAMMILYPNKPTDYCSLGERREDAKTD